MCEAVDLGGRGSEYCAASRFSPWDPSIPEFECLSLRTFLICRHGPCDFIV